MRYVFIESDSGYIWGDETADTLAQATEQMLAESGCMDGRTYEAHTSWTLDGNESGFYVYTVPADFPAIPDGQNQEMIERVQAEGTRFETLIEAEPEEDNEDEETSVVEAAGYIALTDGSEIHVAGYTRTGVAAGAEAALDGRDYVIEEASAGLIDYWLARHVTPTIYEVGGVNCLKDETL